MINIAICDDNEYDAQNILRMSVAYYEQRNLVYNIDIYNSGIDFMKSTNNYKILFLDVDMEGYNGIQIKEMLDKAESDVFIVFITSYQEYIDKAFGRNVLGYIIKPVNSIKLYKVLDKILDYINLG